MITMPHIIIVAMHIIMEILKLSFCFINFAIPIILLSPMMGVNLPFQFTFPGSEWVVLILSTILFFYGGKPFLSGGKDEIATKTRHDDLSCLGISVAYIYSLYAFYMNNFSSATGHTMDFLGISNLNFNYAIRTLDRNECCRKCWRCFKENGRTVT